MSGTATGDLAFLAPLRGELHSGNGTRLAAYGPAPDGLPIVDWVRDQRDGLLAAVRAHGAVLVRGAVRTPEELEEITRILGGEPLSYTERTTPRSTVHNNVYTSTEYPASQTIPQHNETSYARVVPKLLFFACTVPAASGGATPLADSAEVLRRLPEDLVGRFRERGVLYTRAYRLGMGLTWQEAFQTEDRAAVEKYCEDNGLRYEWLEDDALRTSSRRPAVVVDPDSGREVWFNQAHLFHVSNLPEGVRAALTEMYEERDYPRHAYYGDGTPIADEDLAAIRRAYDECLLVRPWEQGDLVVVDNLKVSHGRKPYSGDRRVLVAMAGTTAVDA
ncbi:TauD/TfdA family dioxygenase [Umezawaea sp. NPDC059074]|uniref:TauD/TfdA family dioxygenase n=1 Tax=Umezawaea sp. NPDC059074 TaxID=3346716 RepID=UPI00368A5546